MKFRRSRSKRHESADDYPTRKLVIVGDGTCGKTSLLFAFTRDEFFSLYVPTIFENSVVDIEIKPDKIISLSLWDTAGQETYEKLRPLSYSNTDVVLICYSMDSRDTFVNIKESWHREISCYCPNAKLMLIGCKSDLAPNGKSCVSEQEVQQYADSINAIPFTCSAKTRENVQKVFHTAAEIAYEAGKKKGGFRLFSCFGGR